MSDFELHVSQALGRIEQKVDDLSGPTGRVTKIEQHIEKEEWKQWVRTVAVIPILTVLHAILNKMGWKV